VLATVLGAGTWLGIIGIAAAGHFIRIAMTQLSAHRTVRGGTFARKVRGIIFDRSFLFIAVWVGKWLCHSNFKPQAMLYSRLAEGFA
jgi:hypothetical protein